jgi:uncharacterized protein
MILAALFLLTALLYASVGFGGGSTYSALLVLAEADYRLLPSIALVCNLLVVSGGTLRFARAGHLDLRRAWPWVVVSVPAAWLGGRLPIAEPLFIGLLGLTLAAAGLLMLGSRGGPVSASQAPWPRRRELWLAVPAGTLLGLLAGLVGIGGGIFLAPLLYLSRWGSARAIAATCSFFILVNSLAGLGGQLMKLGDAGALELVSDYWMLFPAVLIGGQIGSLAGARYLKPQLLQTLTAVLILYVAARLLLRLVNG